MPRVQAWFARAWATGSPVLLLALLIGNTIFNIVANASFRVTAQSTNWHKFLFWQVVGNLAGFVTVLCLTGLLHFLPLKVAFPLTTGLAVVAVQVVAASWVFREHVAPTQWAGTLLIAAGIALIGGR